jgi:hypothetical protein
MSPGDKIEQVLTKLLGEYQELVAQTVEETANGDRAEGLRATVAGMTEARAKAMLIARIAAEAASAHELAEYDEDEGTMFYSLGPDPTLN